jgi:hypothetical protein
MAASDDAMRDFLDELDMTPTLKPDPEQAASTEAMEELVGEEAQTPPEKKPMMPEVKEETSKESPKQESGSSTSTKGSGAKTTRTAAAKKTPKSAVPTGRGGFTMYERSILQMEERERKLLDLQQKLMEDCTFSPKSSTPTSRASSPAASPDKVGVFDRLYDDAATRAAHREAAKSTTMTPTRTPARGRGRTRSGDANGTSPGNRLEELFEEGQNKLRTTKLTSKVSVDLEHWEVRCFGSIF